MNHPLKNPQWLLPVIRKVIRRNGVFVCSICRTEYSTMGEANGCLNQCWYEIRNFYPVVKRRRLHKLIYRCQYCCRDYDFETQALACANACSSDRNRQHIQEQLVNDLPVDVPAKRPGSVRLNQQSSLGRRLRRQIENDVLADRPAHEDDIHDIAIDHPVAGEASAPLSQHEAPLPESGKPSSGFQKPSSTNAGTSSKAPAAAAPSAATAPAANTATAAKSAKSNASTQAAAAEKASTKAAAEAPAEAAKAAAAPQAEVNKGRHKDSFPKQWSRQDAKYQCRYCNKRFYTKQEVEDCFNGHFNEDGYEKEVGAGPEN